MRISRAILNDLVKHRDATPLTFDDAAKRLYGPSLLFDLEADSAITALSTFGNYPQLLDWLQWSLTNYEMEKEYFLSYVAASGAGDDTPSNGWVTDICDPGNTIEDATCDFVLSSFGRFRRTSVPRDLTRQNLRYCLTQPTYRIDGTQIMNDLEWDMVAIASALIQDLSRLVITGNKSTAGQHDGLLRLIKTGYTSSDTTPCPAMDSIVVDWNGNAMVPADGDVPEGVTVNGNASSPTDLIQLLRAAVRHIRQRIRLSRFGSASLSEGDVAIVMPWIAVSSLLDAWTCETKCGGDITRIDSFEARNFRDSLNGGPFGDGVLLNFDGMNIPIIGHDYGLDNGDGTVDMLFLTRSIGGQPVLTGQLYDLSPTVALRPDYYQMTDGNRMLFWMDVDNTCATTTGELDWRLKLRAPWAQIKIQNVAYSDPLGLNISSDPASATFFGK